MIRSFFAGLFLTTLSANISFAESVGDPEAGQKLFRQCAACHMIGENAANRVGPVLNDIFGAPAAANADFRYSQAFQTAASDGLVWDDDTLDAFLANPRDYLPGNRMSFRGLRNDEDRASLIAYLKSIGTDDSGLEIEAGFSVAPEILALKGDVEYGEYLASECKTCHALSGDDDGIPNIIGLEADVFATAMHAYREKFRENQVMQLVAGRLNDEEIAALAAFFGSLEN